MRCYHTVSVFVSLVLVISVVDGKHIHETRNKQKESHHKHVHFFFNAKHLIHQRSHKKVAHRHGHLHGNLHGHLHEGRVHVDHLHRQLHFKDHHDNHDPAGFKCRRVKFIVNRNLHMKKETSDALKRRIRMKHTKNVLHKFIRAKKRFHLPREAMLFEDKEGNLATYIEDCVSTEHAAKKNFFQINKELFIAPAFVENKMKRHQRQSSENSMKHDNTIETVDNDVSDEGILPASEDSLLQTVSDTTELLKNNAEKEGNAQFLSDQHDEKEVPSNFVSIVPPAAMDNPIPKNAEEGSDMQRYFSSTGLNNVPQFPSGVDMTPYSRQPVNNPLPQHGNQLPLAGSDASYVTNPAPLGQAFSQGSYTSPLKDPDITQLARFAGNADEQGVAQSFSEAFNKLGDAEEQELASYSNKGLNVPQTLGEAMNVEKAEANYEQTFENVYGKSNSIGVTKGTAFLPEKQQ